MPQNLCECGRPRPRTHEACLVCSWLDGATPKESRVINALRAHVTPANADELATLSEVSRRHVLRTVKGLMVTGRVIKTMGGDGHSTYKLGEQRL